MDKGRSTEHVEPEWLTLVYRSFFISYATAHDADEYQNDMTAVVLIWNEQQEFH